MKRYGIICLAAVLFLLGCTNPLESYIDKPKDAAPGALSNVTAEPGMGIVTFRWQNPDNYYYTEISYTDTEGATIKKAASKYSVDAALGEGYSCYVFTGFEISSEYTFTLIPFSASGKAGPASTITCTPQDKLGVYKFILETMVVEPAPQGAYVSWQNEWEAMVSVTIAFKDIDGNDKVVTVEESDQPQRVYVGSFNVETELTIIAYNSKGAASDPYHIKVVPIAISADTPVLGWFLNKDGSITETRQDSGDNQSFAVIAYVGSVANYFSHFVALALTDCTTTGEDGTGEYKMSHADAIANVGKYAANHPITIKGTTYNTASGTSVYDTVERTNTTSSVTRTTEAEIGWRLPSVTDFRYVMQGLTSKNDPAAQFNATDPIGIAPNVPNNIANAEGAVVAAAINTACGSEPSNKLYWISSLDGTKPTTHAWYYRIDMNGWYLIAQTNTAPGARAVFAY